MVPVACRIPTGQRGKTWDTGTWEMRRRAGPSPAARAVWERPAAPGIVQLCGRSQEVGLPAHLGIAETRQQGLGAEPVVTTDSGHCFQSSVSKGELVPEPRALVGEGKEGQVRPLGPALALPSGDPAFSRSQDKGQTVEVVSLYKEAAGTSRDLGGLLGQHGLLHGLLQRLPRHQQAHHLLRALGEPLPGLVVCDHGHVPAVHLHDLVSNL